MSKPNGGYAFPHTGTGSQDPSYDGMTLRDYFAGQAITSLGQSWGAGHEERAAELAYRIADAMIAERSKP
jgi:hypothetical protein